MALGIDYAQCWEDPRVLRRTLAVTADDDVLSIASGGDNTFALLLDGPRHITALDHNPRQLFLVELKMQAIRLLDYDDFVGFVGARSCRRRERLYRTLRSSLTSPARAYWDDNPDAIKRGIIHCGKFERYLAAFRRLVLPLAPGRRTVRALLSTATIDEQRRVFHTRWNGRRWQGLFRLFFSRRFLGRMGRTRGAFRHVPDGDIARVLLRRARRGFTAMSIGDNFLLHYMLTGRFADIEAAHPYLSATQFVRLRERIDDLKLVHAGLTEYLTTLTPGRISAFNLSDVFEYMGDNVFERTMCEVSRVAAPQARIASWTVFVPRVIPEALRDGMVTNPSPPGCGPQPDRGFFYGSFNAWRVNQPQTVIKPSADRRIFAVNRPNR